MERRRVVVTGLGTVNPCGNNVEDFRASIMAGRSGIERIRCFDPEGYPSQVAGQISDFDPGSVMDRREARRMSDFSVYALAAALEAVGNAGINGNVDPERYGVILGNGIGGFETMHDSFKALFDKGPERIPPLTIPKVISNIAPGNVAIKLNAQGPCYAVVTACSSATDAIGASARWIRDGGADVIVTGGTEAAITPLAVGGFCVIQALSTHRNEAPSTASRPFDKDRDGFVIGEGAGVLVLEDLEHAKRRGAPIICEFGGYGMTCDANHLTAPHPEGRGARLAMLAALRDAAMAPEEIDYINAHGTSTPLNDPTETRAIRDAFGEHAYNVKISSTKSMTGHCIGAAGGIEAVASILAMREGRVPPTINLEEPDPTCDLNYVPNQATDHPIRAVMSNTLGFGGHNGVVIFREYRE
jgi:3-oxoacyl-[acyl-carrier-protein] synthase II